MEGINIFIEAFQITGQAIHGDSVNCMCANGGGWGESSSHFFIHVCQHLFHIGLKHSMTKLSPYQFWNSTVLPLLYTFVLYS